MNHDLFIVKPIRATCTIMRQILSKKLYFLVLAAGLSLVPTITAQEIGHQNDAKKVSQKNAPAASNSSQSEQEKKETEWDPSWSPLPDYGQPALTLAEVRETYAFAARHDDILAYVPCYCGCENEGHKSVLDCFVKGRTKTGAPKWDRMGYT